MGKKHSRIIFSLFIGSTIIPMLTGLIFMKGFASYFIGASNSDAAFLLVFIIGIAITSIPVIMTTKLRRKVIWNFGITMNARGGPGIVLATVAYNYRIINVDFFTVLILTTMLSSLIAGYWLRGQQKKDERIFDQLTEGENVV